MNRRRQKFSCRWCNAWFKTKMERDLHQKYCDKQPTPYKRKK